VVLADRSRRQRAPIVIAAEAMTAAPDFGNLEPMLDATQRELPAAGIDDNPTGRRRRRRPSGRRPRTSSLAGALPKHRAGRAQRIRDPARLGDPRT
jgi:hypothetical protein